jgi:hypothetical protein
LDGPEKKMPPLIRACGPSFAAEAVELATPATGATGAKGDGSRDTSDEEVPILGFLLKVL